MRSRVVIAVLVGWVFAGCSLDRAGVGVAGRDGSPRGPDAAPDDTDAAIAEMDAQVADVDAQVPAADGGPPVELDAYVPPVDAFVCTRHCEGAVVVGCPGDSPVRIDCAEAGATCGAGAMCVGGACSAPTCSADGTAALQCSGGIPGAPAACTRGCTAGTCRPPAACSYTVARTIRPGETAGVDLCGTGNQHDHDGRDTYCGFGANGEDVTVRVEIARAGTYRFVVRDRDAGPRVDPIAYLRRGCAMSTEQLACADDTPEARTARFEIALEAGEYFLVVDSWNGTSRDGTTWSCGTVDYAVTAL